MPNQAVDQINEIAEIAEKKLADVKKYFPRDEYLNLLKESITEIANDMGINISKSVLDKTIAHR
jgi:hypothetical protein